MDGPKMRFSRWIMFVVIFLGLVAEICFCFASELLFLFVSQITDEPEAACSSLYISTTAMWSRFPQYVCFTQHYADTQELWHKSIVY